MQLSARLGHCCQLSDTDACPAMMAKRSYRLQHEMLRPAVMQAAVAIERLA